MKRETSLRGLKIRAWTLLHVLDFQEPTLKREAKDTPESKGRELERMVRRISIPR